MDGGDLERIHGIIQQYFAPSIYTYEGIIGAGANGIIYKIGRRRGQKVALKICPQDTSVHDGGSDDCEEQPEEVQKLRSELEWLQVLRNMPHIITPLHLTANPLARDPTNDTESHGMSVWIFMEYAANGTLNDLIQRVIDQGTGRPFQNRILWRFFMCFLRACLEMAFYDVPDMVISQSLNGLRSRPPGKLVHDDIKNANTVVGGFIPNLQSSEHDITTILKLIDFGEAREIDDAWKKRYAGHFDLTAPEAFQRNLEDIARVMVKLMLLKLDFDVYIVDEVTITVNDSLIISYCAQLWDERPRLIAANVDPDLIQLVGWCLAKDPSKRPGLVELAMTVQQCVRNRDQSYYDNRNEESDNAIRQRMQSLLIDASIT